MDFETGHSPHIHQLLLGVLTLLAKKGKLTLISTDGREWVDDV